VGRVADPRSASGEEALTRRLPRSYIAVVTLAYFGLTAATFAPLQNVIPRMIENASSPSAKAIDLGIVTGLGALAAVVANPLAGHISDRRASVDNRTGMVLIGIVSGAVFLYLLGRQESIAGITVFWVLSQAAVNAVYASLPASIVDQIPPDNWGSVWGLVGTAQALGLVVGFAFVGVIFPGISAGITSLVILYVVTLVPFTVVAAGMPKKAGKSTATDIRFIIELAKHSGFRSVWLGRFLVILANTIALLYLYYYLQDVIHYKKPGEGQLILVTIATIATALAAVIAGRLADRSGRYRIFVVQAVVAMAIAGFVLAAISTWAVAIVAAFALGAGYGVVASAGQALSAQVLPDFASAGRDLGIMNIANTVPQVIGPPVAAGLIYLGAGYRGLFAFAAALALGAAYIIYRLRLPARSLDMRILIGSDTYYPQIDGTSYCPADPALTSTPQPVRVHTVPSFMTPFHPTQRVCLTAAIRRQAGQAVRTIRPDVIHVQGHFPLCRTLMVIAKQQSIPLVATNPSCRRTLCLITSSRAGPAAPSGPGLGAMWRAGSPTRRSSPPRRTSPRMCCERMASTVR
jgi:MFS family permease